ncbi:hypothetical protein EX30DRAFT_393538 [Ascodesmis nigricans]|uniref:CID domain-containing protein n=1 Tax=Ascodesmis nigricans TaxID=341454 RepID=A0A4V3SJH3_9PEZI|nr:hypothetical protein EX30DRAFT_393538 [Ascodesmis nigricans]
MDAFQCRIQFTRQLSSLTASAAAAKQCAQFALKNRDFDEDLFSVILETLQSSDTSMNVRVNVLFFIETLCDLSKNAEYDEYIKLVQRDLKAIVAAVATESTEGAVNLEAVKKIVRNLDEKGLVEGPTRRELKVLLNERQKWYSEHADLSSDDESMTSDEEYERDPDRSKYRFSESVIQQRMEEDRERHKRLRENIWQIPPQLEMSLDPEFEKAWEEASDLNSDDFEIMREENAILAASTA